MRVQTTDALMRPIAEFSHAARTDDLILIGAMAGVDTAVRVAGTSPGTTDFAAQTDKIFDNLETVLAQFGGTVADLMRVKIYLSDMRNVAPYRDMVAARFGTPAFDHVVVASAGYPLPQAVIELDAVARRPGVAPPFACRSLTLAPGAETQSGLADALGAAGIRAETICAATITAVDPAAIVPVAAALGALAGVLPPVTATAAQLGDEGASVLVEAVTTEGPLAIAQGGAFARAGDYLFLPALPGDPAAGAVAAQTRAAWAEIARRLEAAGFPPRSVLRTSNILRDWRHYRAFNDAYAPHVDWPYPPRTTMQTAIAPGADVQIEALAYMRPQDVTVLQAASFTRPD